MEQVSVRRGANVAANTEIDVSDEIEVPIDTREGLDPVVSAVLVDVSAGSGNALTSVGQGAAGDPAAGEIVVVDDHTVALGDAFDSPDELVLTYEAVGEHEVPTTA
jgi:hypothetical protein